MSGMPPLHYSGVRRNQQAADAARMSSRTQMPPPSYPGLRHEQQVNDASRISTRPQIPPPSYSGVLPNQQVIHASSLSTEATTWSPSNFDPKVLHIIARIPEMVNSTQYSREEKLAFLSQLPHEVLDAIYNRNYASLYRRRSAPAAPVMAPRQPEPPKEVSYSEVDPALNATSLIYPPYAAPFAPYEQTRTPEPPKEETYAPLVDVSLLNPAPNAIPPIYPAYAAMFTTSEEARQHRKRIRVAPKTQLTDLERVKRYGRQYWVHKLYDAMIDISNITDNASSIHRTRFTQETAFEQSDLEATAHQLFDEALAVHERGYNRPKIYHKHVVRGKLKDLGEHSIEMRLVRICHHLRINKATVDDALRGGVTLSLLCDNPDAQGNTKQSNNAGNKKRAERLKREKEMKKLEEARKVAEKEVH